MLDFQTELDYTASRIKKLREAKDWNIQELAYQVDKERSYMSKVEKGQINVTYRTLCRIAQVFDVKLSDLVK